MQALSPQRGGDSLFRFAMPDKKSEATAYKKDLIGLFFTAALSHREPQAAQNINICLCLLNMFFFQLALS